MNSAIAYVIVFITIIIGIGSILEYIKQNIKIKSDGARKAILNISGVILSVISVLFLYWPKINLLPRYFSSITGAGILADIIACILIIYVGQFQVSMRLVKALVRKAVKNLLIKYNLESEEVSKLIESL